MIDSRLARLHCIPKGRQSGTLGAIQHQQHHRGLLNSPNVVRRQIRTKDRRLRVVGATRCSSRVLSVHTLLLLFSCSSLNAGCYLHVVAPPICLRVRQQLQRQVQIRQRQSTLETGPRRGSQTLYGRRIGCNESSMACGLRVSTEGRR